MMDIFVYLHYGLSLVLIFIGAKMLAGDYSPIPTGPRLRSSPDCCSPPCWHPGPFPARQLVP